MNLAAGQLLGRCRRPSCCRAPPTATHRRSRCGQLGSSSPPASALGLLGDAASVLAASAPTFRARNHVRALRHGRAAAVRRGRHPDHHRHRLLGAVRDVSVLLRPVAQGPADRLEFLFGTEWNPQAAHARRPGRHPDRLRLRAAAHRHAADHRRSPLRRRPARPVLGDLSGRVRHAALPRLGQADARNPRRHPDRGARLLRRPDGRAADPRLGRDTSASTSRPKARSPPASSWA